MINLLLPNSLNENFRKLRRAKGDSAKLQVAVNALVREGCSVENLERMLRQAGVPKDQIMSLVEAAYPTV